MAKYVIDIDTDSSFQNSFGVKVYNTNTNAFIAEDDLENLEELTPDYISEHFGFLQDEAYNKGLQDSHKCISDGDCLEHLRRSGWWDEHDKIVKESIDNAYHRGLEEGYRNGLKEGRKEANVQAQLDVCHDIENVAKGNYNKGLEDAWECARKVNSISHVPRCELFGTGSIYKIPVQDVIAKL